MSKVDYSEMSDEELAAVAYGELERRRKIGEGMRRRWAQARDEDGAKSWGDAISAGRIQKQTRAERLQALAEARERLHRIEAVVKNDEAVTS